MIKFRVLLAAVASLVCGAALPVPANAQALQPNTVVQTTVGSDTGVWATNAGVEKIAEGVWASKSQQAMLNNYGCAIGPKGLVEDFLAHMEAKGHKPCSPKWYGGLSRVNKEGTMLSLIKKSFAGYLVAESDKGINLTPNHGTWSLYSYDSRSIGRPVFVEGTASASGKMVVADTIKGVITSGSSGIFAIGLNKLLGDDCGGNCGSQFYVAGGSAISGAQAANVTDVRVNNAVANAVSVAPGASGSCPQGTTNCPR